MFGVRQVCAACGQDSWTGDTCTRCMVAAAGPHRSLLFDVHSRAEPAAPEPAAEVRAPEVGVTLDPPAPVLQLAEQARAAGWQVEVVGSQGWEPAGSHVTLFSVRCSWPSLGRAAFAVYRALVRDPGVAQTWAWSSVYVWGRDLPPFGGCGVTELKVYLREQAAWDAMELEAWVLGIREGRGEAAAVAALRKADRAEVKRLAGMGVTPASLVHSAAAVRQGWKLDDIVKILKPRGGGAGNTKSQEAS